MKLKKNILFLIFSLIIVQLIYSCHDCSQSAIGNRTESQTKRRNAIVYSKNETDNTQSRKSEIKLTDPLLNQFFKKYKSSVFRVFTSGGEQGYLGTGFFVSDDGIAVSNYHVFEGTTKGLEIIKTADGQELKLERVLAQNRDNDFIIFKVR
jgi:serine protease Do